VVAATALLSGFAGSSAACGVTVGRRVARFDSFRAGVLSAWLGASAISAALTGQSALVRSLDISTTCAEASGSLSADMYAK
jgi:hypothetical protein